MYIRLIILCIYIFLLACTPENEPLQSEPVNKIVFETTIPITEDRTETISQVWSTELESNQSNLILEIESLSEKPLDEVFSQEELAAFEDWNNNSDKAPSPSSEVLPSITAKEFALSPNGKYLAWIEIASLNPSGTIVFAVSKLVVLDIINQEKQVIYQSSRHPSGSFGGREGVFTLEKNTLNGLTWSPNGQYITFSEGMPGTYQVKIISIATKEINNLGESGEAGTYLSWGSSEEIIATNSPDVLDTINILSAQRDLIQKEIVGSWNTIRGLDWSSDGKTIVFSGYKGDIVENLKLYTLNIDKNEITQLSIDESLSYELPQWSPSKKYIAANARSSPGVVDRLIVYDVENKKVMSVLEGPRLSWNFYWADDEKILLTMGNLRNTPRTIEVFHWQENKIEIIPFPEGVDDGVAIGISLEFH